MKKVFFALTLLLICCIQVNAQSVESQQSIENEQPTESQRSIESNRYRGFVEMNLSRSEIIGCAVNTTHGFQVNSHVFIGGGIGAHVYIHIIDGIDLPPSFALPLYGDVRVNILNGKISPFIDLKAGYSPVNDIRGLYLYPSIGVRIAAKSGPAINIHTGYTLQGDESAFGTDYAHSLTLGIGVDF